jgi:hypothetical protein
MEIAGILIATVIACAGLVVAISAHAKTRGVRRVLTHDRREARRVRVLLRGERTAFKGGLAFLEFTVPLAQTDHLTTLRPPNVKSTDTLSVARSRADR